MHLHIAAAALAVSTVSASPWGNRHWNKPWSKPWGQHWGLGWGGRGHYDQGPQPYGYFINNTIFTPSEGESVTYPRFVELQDGTILATTAYSGPDPPYFPIYESKDGGASWEHVSNLTDQVNGVGFGAQPALAELTYAQGDYPAGTILGTGNSWSFEQDFTRIDVYASFDGARTWEFVSRVAEGGRPNTTNGADPIWEPYLLQYDGEVIAYYSDQRDAEHGQKLAHQTSTDLFNWSPVVNDVAYDLYEARPGMTVVVYIPPIDKWILVHERPIGNSSSYGVNYPVFYKLASDPRKFDAEEDIPLIIDGLAPNASPYVQWSPVGGRYGTIVVSDADKRSVFTNRAGGDRNQWEEHHTPAGAVYSRSLQIFKNKPNHLLIYGGETYDGRAEGLLTPFSATVLPLDKVLQAPANATDE